MSEPLDRIIAEKFEGKPDSYLTRRIETAPDFGYDDEEYELNRRLTLVGKAWKWSQKYGRDVVLIYELETAREESPNEVLGYD